MKKHVLAIALACTAITFAQKNELRDAEKAIKSGDFAAAKTALNAAQPLIEGAKDSEKESYYYLKAMAAYGSGNPQGAAVKEATEAFTAYLNFSETSGKSKYKDEITKLKEELRNKLINNASDAFNAGNFDVASSGFNQLYQLSPTDTVFLFYSAASALNGKDYEKALEGYASLMKMNYTGIQDEFVATVVETGEEKVYPNKANRDFEVKAKLAENPVDRKTSSQRPQIVSNVALLYSMQNKLDEAVAAIQEARKLNPDEVELIKTEANLYIKKEQKDKALEVMNQAIAKQPDNSELYYVAGLLHRDLGNLEEAENNLKKSVALDPQNGDAIESIADLYINKGNAVNDEMNQLGNTKADNIKYDELKVKKSELYGVAVSWLEKSVALRPDNIQTLEVLRNLYGSLDNMEKFKELKDKIEQLQNN
ncbi:MAG: tetratricopeptide repeat protein [Bacteroidetes bacterium]|nr:tetratricopeptide repeat protein [Bacteroidota bacterium]